MEQSQSRILFHLISRGEQGASVSRLFTQLEIKRDIIEQSLEAMERINLVTVRRNANTNRIKEAWITDRGVDVYENESQIQLNTGDVVNQLSDIKNSITHLQDAVQRLQTAQGGEREGLIKQINEYLRLVTTTSDVVHIIRTMIGI